ncbi:hypothetical protein FSP39_006359 [Pinctada imbricata]|uniref:Phospholipid-transporting ATPase n=1 Tax=Pinctada imbricata TaxID=66713 RepID=A0AA88Y5N8_PINIB|nr:hypothetical protein FSP39_006359 [Pinctada imbricata]
MFTLEVPRYMLRTSRIIDSAKDPHTNGRDCAKNRQLGDRIIYVDNKHPQDVQVHIVTKQHYPNNRVVSSKYTAWNFLPKNLFAQFRRIANFYFLCVGVIQLIIDSPVSPATSIVPLVFVVTVTAIKQGYEDWLRHKADNEVNNRPAFVIRGGKLTKVKSMNIRVGDIVKVTENHGFPCDLVMLSSSHTDGNCYIKTANLDGETNLKTHFCVPETRRYQQDDEFTKLSAQIECQQPIVDLYKFVGRINIFRDGEHVVKSLGPENVLLRGATLKNTPYIYGCAIYTGPDTKMALNSKAKATKFSRVERGMNTFLIIFLVVLLSEAFISTVLKFWYVNKPRIGTPWYVPEAEKEKDLKVLKVLQDFLSFMILYNYIIPISLYVTIEVHKFVSAMFLGWDLEMYDEETDSPFKANTSDLNEELGQVEYLFTDKTGTLTENDMQFRQCSINGIKYEEVGGMLCEMSPTGEQSTPVHQISGHVEDFLMVLALCHTVRVDHDSPSQLGAATIYSDNGMDYEYQASSPDEKAFVEACRRYGVVFHGTHDDRHEVTFKGEMRRYKILHVLEFDSDRKRMSVILQDENDEVWLLCKGAEMAVLNRCDSGLKDQTNQHVLDYSRLGLRTLVLARKHLSEKEYKHLDKTLDTARKAMEDREKKLAEAFDVVESGMEVLGATAVEDKLQEDVPKTIQALLSAGMKVWVLTGDKEETAVNISYSAGHFTSEMTELKVTRIENTLECAEQIRKHTHSCAQRPNQKFALIVDGMSLTFALHDHQDLFRALCKRCKAVLCCRMSPLQKAQVVKLMKNSPENPVTAAIGDGANDVSMILEAHVGLGIMGKEGRQAVRSSDYAMAKFKFLMRLLLVHGHFFYVRISTLVQYFFYKNVAFITAQFFYAFYSSFSQQSIYDSYYLMFYNITMTSLPIFLYSITEQHTSQSSLMNNPASYKDLLLNHQDFYKTYLTMFSSGTVWFGMLILVAISLVPDFLLRATRDVGKQIRNYRQMRVCPLN